MLPSKLGFIRWRAITDHIECELNLELASETLGMRVRST